MVSAARRVPPSQRIRARLRKPGRRRWAVTALARVQDALRAHGCRQEGTSWQCPAHEDRKPSLSVSEGDDGRVLIHCQAGCRTEDVLAAVGLTMRDLMPDQTAVLGNGTDPVTDTYVYRDEQGQPLYRVQRTASKAFWQNRYDPGGHNAKGEPADAD